MLSVLMTALLTACATTKNLSNPQYEQFLNQKKAQLIKDGVAAVVVDSCYMRNELGSSHISAEKSLRTAQAIAEQFQQQLKNRHIDVSQSYSPFICGALDPSVYAKFKLKTSATAALKKVESTPIDHPNSPLTVDAKQRLNLLLKMIRQRNIEQFQTLTNKKTTDHNALPILQLNIPEADRVQLRQLLGTRYVFILNSAELQDSAGVKVAQGALSFATSALTGFQYIAVPNQKSNLPYYNVTLIDLESDQWVWENFKNNLTTSFTENKNFPAHLNNTLMSLLPISSDNSSKDITKN